jgi:NADH-quinone oxidoreductase subunit G
MESLNLNDAMGSAIRVDLRGLGPDSIMRILPRLGTKWCCASYFLSLFIFGSSNDGKTPPPFFLDSPWISDTARFFYDGFKQQRLLIPMILLKKSGIKVLTPVSWFNAFSYAKRFLLKTTTVLISIVSHESDLESIFLLKKLLNKFNSEFLFVDTVCSFFKNKHVKNLFTNSEGFFDKKNFQLNFLDIHCSTFVPRLTVALQQSDVCLLLGVNPRLEATALNLRLRQRFLLSKLLPFELGVIGSLSYSLGYDFKHLGISVRALLYVIEGRSSFSSSLLKSKFPLILIGSSFLMREDSRAL